MKLPTVPRIAVIGALSFSTILGSFAAHARPLQIIHTNDLHSHLDHAMDPTRGGYAAVKATIDRIKAESNAQGVDTLVLDAGDFSEDSQFYLANNGVEAWRAMNAMGYDAVTIGNHDWLAGPAALDAAVGAVHPSFAFLGANFLFGWAQTNLVRYMRKYVEVIRSGAKIAILGLTTDDFVYKWMAKPGTVYNPEWKAREELPSIRGTNDYVIALTHMGVAADKSLIRNVSGIDLVVGGHSHTMLQRAETETNPSGELVSIVQTGMHGNYVGDLLVDVEPGRKLEILHYNLVPVYSDGPKDEGMVHVAEAARARLDADYGAEWLREVVGHSDVPLKNAYYQDRKTEWSDFVGNAMIEAGNAEAAMDSSIFEGYDQPAGPITREQLFVLYPRIFEFNRRFGYTVWTAMIRGWVIEAMINEGISLGLPLCFTNIDMDVDTDNKVHNLRVAGAPVQAMRNYKIAIPEAAARGAFGTTRYFHLLLTAARDTGIPIWMANEQHFRTIGGTIHALPSR